MRAFDAPPPVDDAGRKRYNVPSARRASGEMADAQDSGSCARKGVEVQVLSRAPKPDRTNPKRPQQFILLRSFCFRHSAGAGKPRPYFPSHKVLKLLRHHQKKRDK